jgi:hypothetical protein
MNEMTPHDSANDKPLNPRQLAFARELALAVGARRL